TNNLSDDELSNLRLHNIGFVFQGINLIAPLTSLQNVLFPLQLMQLKEKEAVQKAETALDMVGMSDRLHFEPKELSRGQQQRVAVARALVTDPPLILCDEPTASLDQKNIDVVMEELKLLALERNKAIVVVTHDIRLKSYADKIIELENGFIQN
ncbi:MAG TPA: ATP-binding cassette domain-containing protein, partial [Balneolaceae bacterium]|nr:ATP-binding cassette domain-containing protein [Balneolaceae bacterium]